MPFPWSANSLIDSYHHPFINTNSSPNHLSTATSTHIISIQDIPKTLIILHNHRTHHPKRYRRTTNLQTPVPLLITKMELLFSINVTKRTTFPKSEKKTLLKTKHSILGRLKKWRKEKNEELMFLKSELIIKFTLRVMKIQKWITTKRKGKFVWWQLLKKMDHQTFKSTTATWQKMEFAASLNM